MPYLCRRDARRSCNDLAKYLVIYGLLFTYRLRYNCASHESLQATQGILSASFSHSSFLVSTIEIADEIGCLVLELNSPIYICEIHIGTSLLHEKVGAEEGQAAQLQVTWHFTDTRVLDCSPWLPRQPESSPLPLR